MFAAFSAALPVTPANAQALPSDRPPAGGPASPTGTGTPDSPAAPSQAPSQGPPPSTPPPAAVPTPPATAVPLPAPPATTETPPPAAPEAAPTGSIAQIVIKGNVNITADAIRAVMTQKIGNPYNQAAAEKDRDAIRNMGYFNGVIGFTAASDPTGGVDVIYTVVENPIVKKIQFSANTPNGQPTIPADKLKSLMETKEGQVLNTNTLVRDLDKLFNRQTGYARQQGYVIDVSADINIDPTNGMLAIPLVEAHIQAIQLHGNKKTRTIVVTRELRSKPGDVLDEKKLQRDLTRVYNLGLFDQVGPFDEIPTDVGRVIISIPVTEKRSGNVSVGIGYSSRSQLVGRAELAENNFRGLGERVSLQGEVGGVSAQSSLELGFFEPYLDHYHTSLDLDVYDKVIYRFASSTFGGGTGGDSSTYIEKHVGGTVGVSRPYSDTLNGGLTFRSEHVTTNNVDVPLTADFVRQQGNTTALGARAVQNTRDNDFSPAAGGLRALSYELGFANTSTVNNAPTPLPPGTHTFGKIGIDLRQYISLQGPRTPGNIQQPKRVLAVRMLLGFTNKNIPFFEQYFLGGADSLRGYQTDRFFGNNLALFQGELRIPVGKGSNFQAVLLGDAGDAWGSIYQAQGLSQHPKFTLSGDYGLGIRLVTPIGPIRLDYAFPTTGGSGRTQFSIGQSF